MKKSLLTETEIRKFMKFANITPLTENFIDKISEEEDLQETDAEPVEEDLINELPGDTYKRDEDPVEEIILTEEDVDVHAFVKDLMQVVEDHTNVEVTVEEDPDAELPEEEPEMPMDEPEMPMDEPEMPVDEPEEEPVDDLLETSLVAEITRRVAARLLKENKK